MSSFVHPPKSVKTPSGEWCNSGGKDALQCNYSLLSHSKTKWHTGTCCWLVPRETHTTCLLLLRWECSAAEFRHTDIKIKEWWCSFNTLTLTSVPCLEVCVARLTGSLSKAWSMRNMSMVNSLNFTFNKKEESNLLLRHLWSLNTGVMLRSDFFTAQKIL